MPRVIRKESSENSSQTVTETFDYIATVVGHFPTLKKAWQAMVGAAHPAEHDVPQVVRLARKQYLAFFINKDNQ